MKSFKPNFDKMKIRFKIVKINIKLILNGDN